MNPIRTHASSISTAALFSAPFLAAASFSFAPSARADEGMWLFNHPPAKQLKEKYGFEATPQWLEHVQKSAVRISTGGSGSLVSAGGLVMTNHHVGRDMLQKLSTAEKDLLEQGFYTKSLAEEAKCPDIWMDVLWSIDDVTDSVMSAVRPNMTSAEGNDARRKRISEIQDGAKAANSGMSCEMVTLYQGGRYHLYKYKRYTDVRLVMAPEHGIAFYGGDPDNFEFPRFDLDMCFFRIYENDKPLAPEHYLKWSKQGAADNDLVFVAGHPGNTDRLFTVDHLKFMRDVQMPLILRNLWRREVQLQTFSGRSAENERIAESDLFGVQNSRKARTGILAGLQSADIFKAKMEAETALRAKVDANPEWKKKWGGAWDQVARAEKAYGEFYARYGALGAGGLNLGSKLFAIAKDITRLSTERQKNSSDRLKEYSDSEIDKLQIRLYSPAPIYDALEVDNLAARLQLLGEMLGGDDPTVVAALAGKSPRARAEELVSATKLKDIGARKALVAGGETAVLDSKDPMILLARALDPESRKLRKRFEDEVESQEREAYAKIAEALFAVYGEDQYPDATFTLRLSYGTVKGFQDGGRDIAPFTNFAGLYQRSFDRKNKAPFELPPRWAGAKDIVNLSTPFNFVSTCDIIGGNSGSPTINRAGEVVGLIFDGNIQSLILDVVYEDKEARAVSVDTRAILESLRKVYDCGRLADEIASGQLGS